MVRAADVRKVVRMSAQPATPSLRDSVVVHERAVLELSSIRDTPRSQ